MANKVLTSEDIINAKVAERLAAIQAGQAQAPGAPVAQPSAIAAAKVAAASALPPTFQAFGSTVTLHPTGQGKGRKFQATVVVNGQTCRFNGYLMPSA